MSKPNYDIECFLADDLFQMKGVTERDIFGEMLKECMYGMDVVRATNAGQHPILFETECRVLQEIICG